jgi:hypothetical protein
MSVCPFNVLSLAGLCEGGAETLGGGGNGGGNFPRRKPLSVLSVAPPSPPTPSKVSTKSVELDLASDFTSERYSRSSPESVNELRGEADDERGRENRLRKRDTADPGVSTCASSSCVTGSAAEVLGSKKTARKLHVPEMTCGQGTVEGTQVSSPLREGPAPEQGVHSPAQWRPV